MFVLLLNPWCLQHQLRWFLPEAGLQAMACHGLLARQSQGYSITTQKDPKGLPCQTQHRHCDLDNGFPVNDPFDIVHLPCQCLRV